jgi:peptidyl-prolyl cis-trans isomerase D
MASRIYLQDELSMISFFRRALSSWVTFGLLGLILIAFVVTGIGTPSSFGGLGTGGSALASVGDEQIDQNEMEKRLKDVLKAEREKQPGIDMAQLLRGGAAEGVLDELIDQLAVSIFGERAGMVISRRLIDGEIASNPRFFGATGKFDEELFRATLRENGISEDDYRADLKRSIAVRHILTPIATSPTVPNSLTFPYASMKLERRSGTVISIPASLFLAGPVPTEAEITTYYNSNKTRYILPETRVIRYALFDRAQFVGKVVPSEADIETYYKSHAEQYAAKESRGLTQVIIPTQAIAQKIATAASQGTSFAAAAKAAGFDVLTIPALEEKAFAGQSSASVAKAVFAATQGAIIQPAKSGLGWHVVRIDSIVKTPGKTVAQARPEILPLVEKIKVDEAMSDYTDSLDDAAGKGLTFDQIAKEKGLVVVNTPDVTASGIAPYQPNFKADAAFAPLYKEAFLADPDDDPATVSLGGEKFAFFDLGKVNASAPRPLGQIKDQVKADVIADHGSKAAKKAAEAIMSKANGGAPLATAMSAAGVALPRAETVNARRIDVMNAGEKVPPPTALMFSLAARKAKILEMPGKRGWYVVWLDNIEAGDAGKDPELLARTSAELKDLLGREYAQQFAAAAKKSVKVERNDANIAAMKRGLTGTGTQ